MATAPSKVLNRVALAERRVRKRQGKEHRVDDLPHLANAAFHLTGRTRRTRRRQYTPVYGGAPRENGVVIRHIVRLPGARRALDVGLLPGAIIK